MNKMRFRKRFEREVKGRIEDFNGSNIILYTSPNEADTLDFSKQHPIQNPEHQIAIRETAQQRTGVLANGRLVGYIGFDTDIELNHFRAYHELIIGKFTGRPDLFQATLSENQKGLLITYADRYYGRDDQKMTNKELFSTYLLIMRGSLAEHLALGQHQL